MFCKYCGEKIADTAVMCPKCGALQETKPAVVEDNGGFSWGLLGCCVPVVGLVLYFVWKENKPKTAKALCIGAIIGTALTILCNIIAMALGVLSELLPEL